MLWIVNFGNQRNKRSVCPLGHLSSSSKLRIAFRISSFISSHQNFMNQKLKSSGLELLSLSQLHTTCFTSLSVILPTRKALSSSVILLNFALSNLTRWQASPLNLSLKNSLTFSFTIPCSSNHCPFSLNPLKSFLTLLHLITEWKYFVFRSPCFNHLKQTFYCKSAS